MRARFERKREDCWIGVFWRTNMTDIQPTSIYRASTNEELCDWSFRRDIWICLVPMLPLHLTQTWTERR